MRTLLLSLLAFTLCAETNPLDSVHEHLAAGRLDDARVLLRQLPEPGGPAQRFTYWNAVGSLALIDGRLTQAEAAFARSRPYFPAVPAAEQAAVHLNLGALALRLGRFAEGERQTARAIAIWERSSDPRLARALAGWSTALALLKRPAEARAAIDRALTVAGPTDRPALAAQRALLSGGRSGRTAAPAPGVDLAELRAGDPAPPVRVH